MVWLRALFPQTLLAPLVNCDKIERQTTGYPSRVGENAQCRFKEKVLRDGLLQQFPSAELKFKSSRNNCSSNDRGGEHSPVKKYI
uniref:Secreted protein n=1 Tax=Sus scrofa TaxID=9823 RepID=A0A4X1SV68_PIG